jgi:hypothetical protein
LKPISTTTTQIDTLPGREYQFSISPANAAFVMRSMADLYSNRELACIREYSTNARDAHIEAGKADVPIEVTLPTLLNPTFRIRDFGPGMNEYQLGEVYTQFGESTKRDSDDYNGMLGFGSKSAVAYTNTFTITSVQNGIKNVAVITRTEDSDGGYIISLKIVLTVRTTEPSGTVVEIPVHNHSEFSRKAHDFYRYWKPGTVLVDNVTPEWHVGAKMAEGLYMTASGGTSQVVLNGVAYPIVNSDYLFKSGMRKLSFVAFVEKCDCVEFQTFDKKGNPTPNHAQIEFTPNREALKYSDHTKGHLKKIIEDFCSTAVNNAKSEVDNAKSHWEAYDAWANWCEIIGKENVPTLFYKGEELKTNFKIEGFKYNRTRHRYNTDKIDTFSVLNSKTAIFVTDFIKTLTSDSKSKAKQWGLAQGLQFNFIVFTQEKTLDTPWISPERVVRWEDLKAALPKAPKAPRPVNTAPGRKAGTFDTVTAAGTQSERDVPITAKLYYTLVSDWKKGDKQLWRVLDAFKMKDEVVVVPLNRLAKFQRFYPHAKEIWPVLESMVEFNGASLLSADAKEYYELSTNEVSRLSRLDAAKVDDPELKKLIALCKTPENVYTENYWRQERLARVLGKAGKFQNYSKVRNSYERGKKPLEKNYPLVPASIAISKNSEHVYVYLNALYKARKDGKVV